MVGQHVTAGASGGFFRTDEGGEKKIAGRVGTAPYTTPCSRQTGVGWRSGRTAGRTAQPGGIQLTDGASTAALWRGKRLETN